MANDRAVKLIECPRDAWQGLAKQIPTEVKARYLGALINAGFKHIDAVSFVSPRAVPQMTDSEAVLESLEIPGDVEIIGIVVNERGAERAIATGRVTTLGYPCSVSETFLRRNQNQSAAENLEILRAIKARADDARIDMVVYISMAFGNPYAEPWTTGLVRRVAEEIAALGVGAISLADTVGIASEKLIGAVMGEVISDNDLEIGVHLHSTAEDAPAKVLAAYDAGCRRFDSAIGGLGGCPFAQDSMVGNVPTESAVAALSRRGARVPNLLPIQDVTALTEEIRVNFSA